MNTCWPIAPDGEPSGDGHSCAASTSLTIATASLLAVSASENVRPARIGTFSVEKYCGPIAPPRTDNGAVLVGSVDRRRCGPTARYGTVVATSAAATPGTSRNR